MEAPRLLIVEVDKMMANFLAGRFAEVSDIRFDVGITFSGEDALNMVSSDPFDVVLLESELPGIDGIETLRKIKQVDGDTQAILLTEDPSSESVLRALREGAYDLIQKPFEFEQLVETVKNALERRELLFERRRLIKNLSEANDELVRDNRLLLESSTEAEDELKLRRNQIRSFTSYLEKSNMVTGVSECAQLAVRSAMEILDRKQAFLLFLEESHLLVKELSVFENQFWKGQRVDLSAFERLLEEAESAEVLGYEADGSVRHLACVRLSNAGEPVGILCIGNSDDGRPFEEAELSILTEFGGCVSSTLRSALLLDQIHRTYLETILALLMASETKDRDIRVHSQRVADYSVRIAREIGLLENDALMVRYAALLHDVGKIGLKDELLEKKEDLSESELGEIREHEILSDNIVAPMKFLDRARPMIRHHHERYDGGGYPDGLSGNEIPLGARIVAVGDAFDALTSRRSYHQTRSKDEALALMESDSGWFDPEVLEAFKRVLEKESGPAWEEEG